MGIFGEISRQGREIIIFCFPPSRQTGVSRGSTASSEALKWPPALEQMGSEAAPEHALLTFGGWGVKLLQACLSSSTETLHMKAQQIDSPPLSTVGAQNPDSRLPSLCL